MSKPERIVSIPLSLAVDIAENLMDSSTEILSSIDHDSRGIKHLLANAEEIVKNHSECANDLCGRICAIRSADRASGAITSAQDQLDASKEEFYTVRSDIANLQDRVAGKVGKLERVLYTIDMVNKAIENS